MSGRRAVNRVPLPSTSKTPDWLFKALFGTEDYDCRRFDDARLLPIIEELSKKMDELSCREAASQVMALATLMDKRLEYFNERLSQDDDLRQVLTLEKRKIKRTMQEQQLDGKATPKKRTKQKTLAEESAESLDMLNIPEPDQLSTASEPGKAVAASHQLSADTLPPKVSFERDFDLPSVFPQEQPQSAHPPAQPEKEESPSKQAETAEMVRLEEDTLRSLSKDYQFDIPEPDFMDDHAPVFEEDFFGSKPMQSTPSKGVVVDHLIDEENIFASTKPGMQPIKELYKQVEAMVLRAQKDQLAENGESGESAESTQAAQPPPARPTRARNTTQGRGRGGGRPRAKRSRTLTMEVTRTEPDEWDKYEYVWDMQTPRLIDLETPCCSFPRQFLELFKQNCVVAQYVKPVEDQIEGKEDETAEQFRHQTLTQDISKSADPMIDSVSLPRDVSGWSASEKEPDDFNINEPMIPADFDYDAGPEQMSPLPSAAAAFLAKTFDDQPTEPEIAKDEQSDVKEVSTGQVGIDQPTEPSRLEQDRSQDEQDSQQLSQEMRQRVDDLRQKIFSHLEEKSYCTFKEIVQQCKKKDVRNFISFIVFWNQMRFNRFFY